MRVVNLTRDRVLADRAQEAKSTRERTRGLLGRDVLPEGEALIIRPCTSIHSFFMRFVFDAAFVDGKGRVLHVIHAMKPWRMSRIVWRAKGVVELPEGVLRETGTQVGDLLEFPTS